MFIAPLGRKDRIKAQHILEKSTQAKCRTALLYCDSEHIGLFVNRNCGSIPGIDHNRIFLYTKHGQWGEDLVLLFLKKKKKHNDKENLKVRVFYSCP